MEKLPQLTARELIKILVGLDFEVKRQSGSHVFLRHKDGRTTVVPDHLGEKLDRGLLNEILRKNIGISREDFEKLL